MSSTLIYKISIRLVSYPFERCMAHQNHMNTSYMHGKLATSAAVDYCNKCMGNFRENHLKAALHLLNNHGSNETI